MPSDVHKQLCLKNQGYGATRLVLTHPSRWSAAALAGCTTVSNCATIEPVEGLSCVMQGNVAPMEFSWHCM